MREANLQKKVIQYLRDQGDYVFKVVGSPMQQRGTADLLVCHRGLFVALELKAPGGIESGPQKRERRLVLDGGGLAAVISSMESLEAFSAVIDANWIKAHPWDIAGCEIKDEDLISYERKDD